MGTLRAAMSFCSSVRLFVCLSPVEFVKSFARWQHLAACESFSYRLRYTCLGREVASIIDWRRRILSVRVQRIRRKVVGVLQLHRTGGQRTESGDGAVASISR